MSSLQQERNVDLQVGYSAVRDSQGPLRYFFSTMKYYKDAISKELQDQKEYGTTDLNGYLLSLQDGYADTYKKFRARLFLTKFLETKEIEIYIFQDTLYRSLGLQFVKYNKITHEIEEIR